MLLALLMCYAGFTALCLSTDRHHGELLHRKLSPRRRLGLRVAGWLLLTALFDQWFAAQPATMQQTREILPSIVQYSAIFSVVLGGLPALFIEYFLSRRYLHRIAGNTKSST